MLVVKTNSTLMRVTEESCRCDIDPVRCSWLFVASIRSLLQDLRGSCPHDRAIVLIPDNEVPNRICNPMPTSANLRGCCWRRGGDSLVLCLSHTLVLMVTKQLICEQARVTLAGFMVLRDGAAGPGRSGPVGHLS